MYCCRFPFIQPFVLEVKPPLFIAILLAPVATTPLVSARFKFTKTSAPIDAIPAALLISRLLNVKAGIVCAPVVPLNLTVLPPIVPKVDAPGVNVPAMPILPLPARVILEFVLVTVKLL